MAVLDRSCSFIVLLCVCVASSHTFGYDGYYAYNVGRRKDTHDISVVELDPQTHTVVRRYVDTVIPRLADSYVDPPQKGEYGSSPGKRREALDMLGDVAVRPEHLSGGSPPSSNVPPPPAVTSAAAAPAASPEQAKTEPAAGGVSSVVTTIKVDPLEDKDMSKTTKKILANSPPKITAPPNVSVSVNVTSPDGKGKIGSTGDMYTVPEYPEFPKDISNNTLTAHNITAKKVDHHVYYNSTFQIDENVGQHVWVNMSNCSKPVVNEILSKSHRRATTVTLSFEFPFYGQPVKNVAIATGGFLYTGDYIHSWLAATQYIAPLMANFDTSISPTSQVKYCDNGTAFTVEWEKVLLQDKAEAGEFTFQATLHKNGDIVFVYKSIPILVEEIEDSLHPVKVGLSDAYIIDRTVYFVRRKTIYEYHRVNFRREDIKNWTVIHMTALPTCLDYKTCETCLDHETTFDCKWCPSAERCSSGFDRQRQDWTWRHCDVASLGGTNVSACSEAKAYRDLIPPSSNKLDDRSMETPQVATVIAEPNSSEKAASIGHTGMMGLLLFVLMISGVGLWVFYSYRNPHSQSGQFLIKYRPSQWGLRRGEARYTAASIHM